MGGGIRADDGLENLVDADAVFSAGQDALAALDDEQFFDFAHDAFGIGRRQVDLVDDRNDGEIVFQREMVVRERLRLDALRRIDNQQRAFARRERARDFIREIDVSGRVDQIELVRLPVFAPYN